MRKIGGELMHGGGALMAEAIRLLPIGLAEAEPLADSDRTPARGAARRGPRARPPRHLADLDLAGRRAAVTELGQPAFRADQLSRHYFSRLTDEPADMTDLPAATRADLAAALLPPLLTAQREQECDGGTDAQDAVAGL